MELLSKDTPDKHTSSLISQTKTNIIKQIADYPQILLCDNYLTCNLYSNLDKSQLKHLSKAFLKSYSYYSNIKIFKTDAVLNNKELLQALLLKVCKNIWDSVGNVDNLSKALGKSSFDVTSFVKDIDFKEYMNITSIQNEDEIEDMIEVLKLLQIHYMDENYQLTAILVLLLVKKCCQTKKIKKSIDNVLQNIYELSPKYPDMYKIFPVDYIFDFNDTSLIDLLKLTIKTPDDTLILKSVLEIAVKKVKTDSEIVKNIVEVLLKNHKSKGVISSIEYFQEPVFQIICIILPLIAKEKKAITTSAYRSILANLQDKLNKAMLDSFQNIDFSKCGSFLSDKSGNTDDSTADSESPLNALGAYTLTLLKYCESNDAEELNNMDCLLSGLEFFIHNAVSKKLP